MRHVIENRGGKDGAVQLIQEPALAGDRVCQSFTPRSCLLAAKAMLPNIPTADDIAAIPPARRHRRTDPSGKKRLSRRESSPEFCRHRSAQWSPFAGFVGVPKDAPWRISAGSKPLRTGFQGDFGSPCSWTFRPVGKRSATTSPLGQSGGLNVRFSHARRPHFTSRRIPVMSTFSNGVPPVRSSRDRFRARPQLQALQGPVNTPTAPRSTGTIASSKSADPAAWSRNLTASDGIL